MIKVCRLFLNHIVNIYNIDAIKHYKNYYATRKEKRKQFYQHNKESIKKKGKEYCQQHKECRKNQVKHYPLSIHWDI